MSSDNDTGMGLRFIETLTSVLRPICEVRQMLAEEDRTAINMGLARIYEKSDVVALGESIRALARDVILVIHYSYEEHPACASMVVRLEEAEQNLAVLLDDVRKWRSNLNNNF